MRPFRIQVPASSANLGAGFDSMGLALNLYLTLDIEPAEEWLFINHSPHLEQDLDYRDNFIYQVAKKIASRYEKTLPACKITVKSDIPLARGLGSSASAIMAGIEIANQLGELGLSTDQKLKLGTEIEKHPDNIAPALMGGVIIAVTMNDHTDWVKVPDFNADSLLYIPKVELKTEASRNVLPDHFSREQAVQASAISNVLIASLLTGDYPLAGDMMEKDMFHEPYRQELIPNYKVIKTEAKKHGAYGTVISGAGPTMISFTKAGEGGSIAKRMEPFLPNYDIKVLKIDQNGLTVSPNGKLKAAAE
jgi:homoserine kinase